MGISNPEYSYCRIENGTRRATLCIILRKYFPRAKCGDPVSSRCREKVNRIEHELPSARAISPVTG